MKKFKTNPRKDSDVFFRTANGGRSINIPYNIPRGGIRF